MDRRRKSSAVAAAAPVDPLPPAAASVLPTSAQPSKRLKHGPPVGSLRVSQTTSPLNPACRQKARGNRMMLLMMPPIAAEEHSAWRPGESAGLKRMYAWTTGAGAQISTWCAAKVCPASHRRVIGPAAASEGLACETSTTLWFSRIVAPAAIAASARRADSCCAPPSVVHACRLPSPISDMASTLSFALM